MFHMSEAKLKFLKVTKSDKTVHVVPVANRPFYEMMNNRILRDGDKWKLEDVSMTEKEFYEVPATDETYLTGAEAVKVAADQSATIEALQAELSKYKSLEVGEGPKLDALPVDTKKKGKAKPGTEDENEPIV